MNKKTTWFLLFIAASITFSACKKEDPIEPVPPAPTKKELLTKKWKADQVLVDSLDVTFFFSGFRLDFRADNTVIVTSPPEAPDTSVWAFNATETQIILDPGVDEEVVDILTLTATQLKLRIADPDEETLLTMSPAAN